MHEEDRIAKLALDAAFKVHTALGAGLADSSPSLRNVWVWKLCLKSSSFIDYANSTTYLLDWVVSGQASARVRAALVAS